MKEPDIFDAEVIAKYPDILDILEKQCKAEVRFSFKVDGEELSMPKDLYVSICKEALLRR